MSDRRRKPPNKWGCKPSEDVCLEHCEPLVCRHGCEEAKPHKCGDKSAAHDTERRHNEP
jgi:hypothetical protein